MYSATSLEWVAYSATRDLLKHKASQGVFSPVGGDSIRGIDPAAVIGRFAPKIQPQRGQSFQGESNIPLPAILITWIGHNRPVSAGENCYDDGQITMLIQVVDRLDRTPGDTGLESYMCWMNHIREALQANPYRQLTGNTGDIFLVHMSEKISGDNQAYINDEARLVCQLTLFTRSRRDTGEMPHDT